MKVDGPSVLSLKKPVKRFMVESMSVAIAKELERRWKSYHKEEVALFLKKMNFWSGSRPSWCWML